MSKALEWLRSRSQKGKADKASSGESDKKQSGEGKLRTDSSSRSGEFEGLYRGRNNMSNERPLSRSSEYEAGRRYDPGENLRFKTAATSRSDDFGRPAPGSRVSREWQSGSADTGREDKLHDEKRPLGRYASADWASHVSRSSTSSSSTERNPSGGVERRSSLRGTEASESEVEEPNDNRHQALTWSSSKPKVPKELEPDTFESLLKNWPVLKSSSSEKRKFEARLVRLFEFEREIVVTGDQRTTSRWSLGIMDEGIRALGTAIASRGYPKLKTLSFTHCRLLLESPFATLARSFNTSNLPNLEVVNFYCNHYINNRGFIELARAFRTGGHFSALTTLILIDNGMQDDGLMALVREAFRSGNLSNLRKLHIGSHNVEETNNEEFHVDAAREFARELSSSGHLPQLEDLRFRGCVDWRGVASIVEALGTRITGALKCLDLKDSPLEINGMEALARVVELPQFSSLQSLNLSVSAEEMPIVLNMFKSSNLCALQRVALSEVSLGEQELVKLAALLEARHLPALLEFYADCHENTIVSGQAFVQAYERNNCLAAKLNFPLWPSEELQIEVENRRKANQELDELV